jgi:uncharacterized membrane protein YhhN
MKQTHRQLWGLAYAAIALAELTGEWLAYRPLVLVFKPLLMPTLILGFLFFSRNHRSFWQLTITVALGASAVGDILLMGGEALFLAGVAAFFVAQVGYTVAFGYRSGWLSGHLAERPLAGLPTAICLLVYWIALEPYLPDTLRIPVGLYALALGAMVLAAYNLRNRITAEAWPALMSGAVLFLVSDSLIAWNKFARALPGAGVAIMATYMAAQWLLTTGALKTLLVSGPKPQK